MALNRSTLAGATMVSYVPSASLSVTVRVAWSTASTVAVTVCDFAGNDFRLGRRRAARGEQPGETQQEQCTVIRVITSSLKVEPAVTIQTRLEPRLCGIGTSTDCL